MGCDYAFDAGRQSAIRRFHLTVSELMDKAIADSKSVAAHTNQYWREIGKQDILLGLLAEISNMINTKD